MPSPAEIPVSEHLKRIPPARRSTFQAARRAVKSAAPKAKEVAYRSSRTPGAASRSMYKVCRYVVDDVPVAGLGTFPTYVSLFFSRGGALHDDSGLLEGTGDARFIKLHTPADAARPAVTRLIRKAVKLGGITRGEKR